MKTNTKQKKSLELALLRQMKRIRFTEETIAERYNEWKMRCPTHLCIGQEAIAAAAGEVLRRDDFVVSTHRAHGHYLAKGGNLKKMIAEIYGKASGCSGGKGGSMHLIDKDAGFMGSTAIVGGTIPIAVGLGLSIQLHGTDQVSAAFFGDGAIEEGVFYESVNFAALKKLPVLFICENNLYSVYSPFKVRQPEDRKIHKMVESIGIPGEQIDGNNVMEVYNKLNSAAQSIRNGEGPRFFEFSTYRWREHCGPNFDNDIGYRSQEEYLSWKERDSIVLLEEDIVRNALASKSDLREEELSIQAEIDEAFAYAESSPFPKPEEAFKGLFRT